METDLETLPPDALMRFRALQADAVNSVTARFYATHGSAYERFGPRGREACREDLAYHLEFLRPVLEFGFLQPMVDYLSWLASVLKARSVPVEHLPQSLDWLAGFFSEQMNGAEGAQVACALQAARTEFLAAGAAPMTAQKAPEPWPEAAVFEAALLAGHQHEAIAVVNRCMDQTKPLVDIEMHVIQPALYQIGEKWQSNQVSVAQEHLATAMAQAVMTMGLLRSSPLPAVQRRVLLGCVEGNTHVVGLRMVADAFQLAGWEVQYLGANVPTMALAAHAADWKPDLVGLSVSFAHQMRAVKAVIAQLKERLGEARPAVIVGGIAFNRFLPLAGAVGADLCSIDARAAVVDAIRLVSDRDPM